jgi:hypothetical protein
MEEVIEKARAVLDVWRDVPDWIWEADRGEFQAVAAAMHGLRDSLVAHYAERHEANRPTTLRGLPVWQVAFPEKYDGRDSWGFALPNGAAGATDGYGCVVVDDGDAPPLDELRENFNSPTHASERMAAIFSPMPHGGAVTVDTLRSWLDAFAEDGNAKTVVVGETVLDADLVRRWALSAAEIAGGPIAVRWNGALNQALFEGHGWRAAVMPRRSDAKTAPLAVEPPR